MKKLLMPLLLVLGTSACGEGKNGFDCKDFMTFAGDSGKALAQFKKKPDETAWNWFVCMNQASPAGSEVRVWETLKPTAQVFLSNGEKPLPYAERVALPTAVKNQMQKLGMSADRVPHNLDSIQQVDGLILEMGGAVPDAQKGKAVRFQLLMNGGTFDYILSQAVYNVNGQAKLTEDLDFPAAAWELKTSWLWIGSDQAFHDQLTADGYYIVQAYFRDGASYSVGYAALSGMHIINKLTTDWVWATFENVNNSKYTVTNDIPPKPMTNTTGPTAAAIKMNSSFQKNNPSLSQYELIGVQFQFGQDPILLANSQLESAFQSQSSCIACHSTAAFSAQNGYFNFALKKDGGIVYPTAALPQSEFEGYRKLDFVWSLKRASWKR